MYKKKRKERLEAKKIKAMRRKTSRKKACVDSKNSTEQEAKSAVDAKSMESSATDLTSLKSFVQKNIQQRNNIFGITRTNPYLIKIKNPEEGKQIFAKISSISKSANLVLLEGILGKRG